MTWTPHTTPPPNPRNQAVGIFDVWVDHPSYQVPHRITDVYYSFNRKVWLGTWGGEIVGVTHWMPPPQPPEEEK